MTKEKVDKLKERLVFSSFLVILGCLVSGLLTALFNHNNSLDVVFFILMCCEIIFGGLMCLFLFWMNHENIVSIQKKLENLSTKFDLFKRRYFKQESHDPVYGCKLYKDYGCSFVDGIICDFPNCSMLKEYLTKIDNKKDLKAKKK